MENRLNSPTPSQEEINVQGICSPYFTSLRQDNHYSEVCALLVPGTAANGGVKRETLELDLNFLTPTQSCLRKLYGASPTAGCFHQVLITPLSRSGSAVGATCKTNSYLLSIQAESFSLHQEMSGVANAASRLADTASKNQRWFMQTGYLTNNSDASKNWRPFLFEK